MDLKDSENPVWTDVIAKHDRDLLQWAAALKVCCRPSLLGGSPYIQSLRKPPKPSALT